jgi:phytoene synthase
MKLEDAYRQCEQITSHQARNFAYGIRLLPAPKRRSMSALYAMARRIDDIGDGELAVEAKLEALARVRKDLDSIGSAGAVASDDPVLTALADTSRVYPLPLSALAELIDGCEMDVTGASYETFEDLLAYCRRVAGSVGRMSLSIYGCDDPATAEPLADALGVALQLTNILRDVVEDRETMGRVYLPTEDLERFGVPADLGGPEDSLIALVVYEATRAQSWYRRGEKLLPLLDRRSRGCTAAMAGIYRRLLGRILADPTAITRQRVRLGSAEKLWVASKSLVGGRL